MKCIKMHDKYWVGYKAILGIYPDILIVLYLGTCFLKIMHALKTNQKI